MFIPGFIEETNFEIDSQAIERGSEHIILNAGFFFTFFKYSYKYFGTCVLFPLPVLLDINVIKFSSILLIIF